MQLNGTSTLHRPASAVPPLMGLTSVEAVAVLAGFSFITNGVQDLSEFGESMTGERLGAEVAALLAEHGPGIVKTAVRDLPMVEDSGYDDDRELVEWFRLQVATHLPELAR